MLTEKVATKILHAEKVKVYKEDRIRVITDTYNAAMEFSWSSKAFGQRAPEAAFTLQDNGKF